MSKIKCFLLEPTELAQRSLRRYSSGSNCSGLFGYHNACNEIDAAFSYKSEDDGISHSQWPRDDHRWPKRCPCGYEFAPDDEWQVNIDRLYKTGEALYTLADAPIGAIWRATWYEPYPKHCGPDGRAYVVKTPGGDWCIDMGSTESGQKWTRTGEPPNFTVRPSILIGWNENTKTWKYHGFLTDGYLIEV